TGRYTPTLHDALPIWLTKTLKETGLASAYGYATVACGFKMLRHEGKLTGLSAYGEPKLADAMAAQFRFNQNDGLIESDFSNWERSEEHTSELQSQSNI